ncbi:MAG: cobalt ECF transporter T component CbiQ [Syntrophales bacterium]|nr:cobalt ECF transporter T component CbiQ [Syntrophales bacterium]
MIFSGAVSSDHVLAGIDGRLKVLVSLVLLFLVLSYHGFAFQIIVTVISAILCRVMKVPWKTFMMRLSEPLFLVLIICILKIFTTDGAPLISWDILGMHLDASWEGLREGLFIGSRILAAVSLMAVLVFSTPFTELMAALSWFHVPRSFVEILLYAYRYIFVLFEDAGVIYSAQKNRLGYAAFKNRFSSFGTLTGSLILKAFEHSQNVTTAMVQRGYDGHIPLLRQRPFRFSEVIMSCGVIIVMGVLWNL